MVYYEIVKRVYENMVTIEYEYVDSNNIYIHSIKSVIPQECRGTIALQNFLREFSSYNIYLYASSENGTDESVLNNWYEKNGFIPCSRNVGNNKSTHYKLRE